MDNFTSPATLPGTGVHEPSVTAGDCVYLVCKCVQTQNLFGGILEMYHVAMSVPVHGRSTRLWLNI